MATDSASNAIQKQNAASGSSATSASAAAQASSQPGIELAWAAVEALVAELPLAAFCFWIAFDAESVAVARRFVGASAPTGHSEATG